MTKEARCATEKVKVLEPVCYVTGGGVAAEIPYPSVPQPPIAEESYLLVLDVEQVYTMPEVRPRLEICLIRSHPRQLGGETLVAGTCLAPVHRVPYVSVHLWPPVDLLCVLQCELVTQVVCVYG